MVLNNPKAIQFLTDLEAMLRKELLRTWKEQGHHMDGKIVDTMEFVIEQTVEKLSFLAYMFPYGGYIQRGVPASSIPFSGITGRGGTSRYIQALIGYAQKRMALPDKEAKQVAFAIAHKQKAEGMPTRASARFSSTGKRTDWIGATLERSQQDIERAMFAAASSILSLRFDNMITKYQTEFKKGA
jgi:hypothetical protein